MTHIMYEGHYLQLHTANNDVVPGNELSKKAICLLEMFGNSFRII